MQDSGNNCRHPLMTSSHSMPLMLVTRAVMLSHLTAEETEAESRRLSKFSGLRTVG